MSVLIWIQTFWHSYSVSERTKEKVDLKKKSADDNKRIKNDLSTFSNIISETTGLFELKFHKETP